jgi:alpha-D-ribose 1-methylphosphonate 5-triphosphate synthase subunit PhnH
MVAVIPANGGISFANSVLDAQKAFRAVLSAIALPGRPVDADIQLADSPIPSAALAALLSLADVDTTLWIDPSIDKSVGSSLRFQTGVELVGDRNSAMFVLLRSPVGLRDIKSFAAGTAMSPETSATIVVIVDRLVGGHTAELSGPGFDQPRKLAPSGFDMEVWEALATNHARFPIGVDVLLACGATLIGLPRSTSIRICGVEQAAASSASDDEQRMRG